MVQRKARVNAPNRPSVDVTPNPYVSLILAIVHRAVQDAQGHCDSPGHDAPERLESEAQRWLADTQAVEEMIELTGFDAGVVLARLRAQRETGHCRPTGRLR